MSPAKPEDVRRASLTSRWSALGQLGAVAADLHHFDRFLLREPRLLVPVDVQALVVRAGMNDAETMVRLPFRDKADMPPLDVADPGAPRPEGVHLLWSVPAALGHGRLADDPLAPGDATRRKLELPILPDRWVVLRLAVPEGAAEPSVAGWVLEADSATVTPLADWPDTRANTLTVGPAVEPAQLNAHIGGPSWTHCYDAAAGRLALHDPLTDLTGVEVEGDAVAYLVAGWWSRAADDPLDGVGTEVGYVRRLSELGWADPDHPSPDTARRDEADKRSRVNTTFGLAAASRYMRETVDAEEERDAAARAKDPTAARPATAAFRPAVSGFVSDAITAALLTPAPTRSTLLHGRLHGVPLRGALTPENKPAKDALRVVLGSSIPDVAATLSVDAGLGAADEAARRAAERLLAAFSAGLTMRLGEADVWADIDQYEHAQAYGSLPGGIEGVDRFVDKPPDGADPGSGFRAGKVSGARLRPHVVEAIEVLWNAVERPAAPSTITAAAARSIRELAGRSADRAPEAREVPRPAPRYHYPAPPVLAVAGAGRTLTAVEREEADHALVCRLSDQVSRGHLGVLPAHDLLSTIGSAAVPVEVLALARETLAEDPYLVRWRTRRAARDGGFDAGSANLRFAAESAVAFGYYAADNSALARYTGTAVTSAAGRQRAIEGLLRLSVSEGTWAHPEGVTMWGQPWRPMFCDWKIVLELGPLAGWQLEGTDLEATTAVTVPDTLELTGRSALLTGVADTLSAAIDRWLKQERERDLGGHGLAAPATESALATLRDTLSRLDLLSAALDGVREQLLGLRYDRGLVHDDEHALPDGTRRALVTALPRLLAAGRLTLTAARLVDAFGRLLDLPSDALLVPARLADPAEPHRLLVRPRLTTPARWRFDLVDATATGTDAPMAHVDQADPAQQITPVAGFLLPDHVDESLEVFAADGRPLGELLHDPFSDAVTWEIAPGRTDVAPAAGPTDDPDPRHHRVGWIAAGLVTADATERKGTPARPETESALSALLRAVDTTLWTVDPFGALGKEHIAGLVGRPIAVVAARLSLDSHSDADDRYYDDDTLRTGRIAAYDALAELELPVRLGELTRSDDGLLGYFVDDDYEHFHVVDHEIAVRALPSGRCRGVLALDAPRFGAPQAITHSYVDTSGVLRVHPGQTVRLTLLMHPGGKVHLTSGILPRTSRALSRDWVEPGLKVLAPSLRCGPLLVDADKVRLPKVASFPAEQLFTHRDSPASWRDDPILAATQSALLPDQPPEVREGWVRIAPDPPASGGAR